MEIVCSPLILGASTKRLVNYIHMIELVKYLRLSCTWLLCCSFIHDACVMLIKRCRWW